MNRAPMNRAPNDLFTYIGPSFNIIDICFVYVSHVCPGPATEPGPEAIPSDPALYRPAYSKGFTLLSRQHQSIASFDVYQWCTTSRPRATSGPRRVLMWP